MVKLSYYIFSIEFFRDLLIFDLPKEIENILDVEFHNGEYESEHTDECELVIFFIIFKPLINWSFFLMLYLLLTG